MLFPLLVVSLGGAYQPPLRASWSVTTPPLTASPPALQTLGTSSLVYARSNTERAEINPKTAIEAAVRTIVGASTSVGRSSDPRLGWLTQSSHTESPTSRCADTCEFVKGLDSISVRFGTPALAKNFRLTQRGLCKAARRPTRSSTSSSLTACATTSSTSSANVPGVRVRSS